MKSLGQVRLERLRLATALASSKNIPASAVVPTAMEFFKWIDDPDAEADTSKLATHWRAANR